MDAGTKIVRSCELIESIWTQVDDLTNSLAEMTERSLMSGELSNFQRAGSLVTDHQTSDSGWTYTATSMSFPMMEARRRKEKPTAWINYQISVGGSGIPRNLGADQREQSVGPTLHVSFWEVAAEFGEPGLYVEFPSVWEDWSIQNERLICWEEDKIGGIFQWTFSIRLLDICNEDALRATVIAPICALLRGDEVSVALPDATPGLIFYAGDVSEDGSGILTALNRKATTPGLEERTGSLA